VCTVGVHLLQRVDALTDDVEQADVEAVAHDQYDHDDSDELKDPHILTLWYVVGSETPAISKAVFRMKQGPHVPQWTSPAS
jgi:hypothetical protein